MTKLPMLIISGVNIKRNSYLYHLLIYSTKSMVKKENCVKQDDMVYRNPACLYLGHRREHHDIDQILHSQTKKTPTTVFLTVLECSDMLTLITLAPRWTLIYLFRIDARHFGNVMCKLHWYLVNAAPLVSVWNLVAMTFERLAVTIQPHKARHYFTEKLAIKITVGIIAVSVLMHTHLLYGFSLKEVHCTTPGKKRFKFYSCYLRWQLYRHSKYNMLHNKHL